MPGKISALRPPLPLPSPPSPSARRATLVGQHEHRGAVRGGVAPAGKQSAHCVPSQVQRPPDPADPQNINQPPDTDRRNQSNPVLSPSKGTAPGSLVPWLSGSGRGGAGRHPLPPRQAQPPPGACPPPDLPTSPPPLPR